MGQCVTLNVGTVIQEKEENETPSLVKQQVEEDDEEEDCLTQICSYCI